MEIIGDYNIIKNIGSGGMADVFKVSKNDNVYALKLLKKNLASTQGIVDRFNSEAEMLKILSHPNIVKVYDTFTVNEQPAILMEYLEGDDLKQYITNNHPIPMPDVINIFFQTMDAIRFAHHKGITHRDIKPENVIITKDKKVKLIDFGIAKIKNQYYTMTGQFLGSIVYSSPEQLKSAAKVDHRTDIYSLGVFLYHLIEGKIPYDSLSISEIIENINSKDLPRLTRLTEFQPFIDKTTAKNPDKRFQTIEELKITLDLYFSPGSYNELSKQEKEKIVKDLYSSNYDSQENNSPDNKLFKTISQNLDVKDLHKFFEKTPKDSNSVSEKTVYGVNYKEKEGVQYLTYENLLKLEKINKYFWSAKGRITGVEFFVRNLVAEILSFFVIGIYISIINLIKRLKDIGLSKSFVTIIVVSYLVLEIIDLLLLSDYYYYEYGIILLVPIIIFNLSLYFIKGKERITEHGLDSHLRKIKTVSEEEYKNI